jgi:hypothetical protein
MRRLVLVASALAVFLGASGAGYGRARTTNERALVAERKASASRRAELLLRRFVPPAGARPARNPPRDLRFKPAAYSVETAGPHRYFRTAARLGAVVADVEAHLPRGFRARTEGQSLSPRGRLLVIAPAHARIPTRFLTVNMRRERGQTLSESTRTPSGSTHGLLASECLPA